MAQISRVEKTYQSDPRTTKDAANENRPPLQVIKGSDRSFLNDPTRNVETTNKNRPQNQGHQDIATTFSQSYAKQGIQPRGLVDDNQEERRRYQQPEQITRSAATESRSRPKAKLSSVTKRKFLKKRSVTKRVWSKTKVTEVNAWVTSFGFSIYVLQLIAGLVGTFTFALVGYIKELTETTEPDTELVNGVEQVILSVAFKVAQFILNAIGYDINEHSPEQLFGLTVIIVMFVGITTLSVAYISYIAARLNPVSGHGSGLKMTFLMMAIIGYTVGALFPFTNIIPWFLFWTIAVWLYPK